MASAENMEISDIACVILAGGRSRRFGKDKGLATVHGKLMIEHSIERLRAQTRGQIVINARRGSDYAKLGLDVIEDALTDVDGPLAGIHAALAWAERQNLAAVITSAVDTPLIPEDFISVLSRTGNPAVATYNGQMHPLHGYWPVYCKDRLEQLLNNGTRTAKAWADVSLAMQCEFKASYDPFFNVNTGEDLIDAHMILSKLEAST